MVWGFELPQVINNPGVGAFLRGDKTPGVATKGDGVTGEDGRGRGGDGNPPTTHARKGSRDDHSNDSMSLGLRTAELLTQRHRP